MIGALIKLVQRMFFQRHRTSQRRELILKGQGMAAAALKKHLDTEDFWIEWESNRCFEDRPSQVTLIHEGSCVVSRFVRIRISVNVLIENRDALTGHVSLNLKNPHGRYKASGKYKTIFKWRHYVAA